MLKDGDGDGIVERRRLEAAAKADAGGLRAAVAEGPSSSILTFHGFRIAKIELLDEVWER